MQTIDINAKEWFDRINGNSYFSAVVTIDYQLPTEAGLIDADKHDQLSMWCRDHDIILRHNIQTGCKKREL